MVSKLNFKVDEDSSATTTWPPRASGNFSSFFDVRRRFCPYVLFSVFSATIWVIIIDLAGQKI